MHNLEIRKLIISCNLTPEQWGLYDEPASFAAARALNDTVVEAFNSDRPKHEKLLMIYQTMKEHRSCGATDSETYNAVDEIFNAMRD
jgi:hypothetical protein